MLIFEVVITNETMKKFLIALLVLVGIGAVAVVTCPNKEAHKDAIHAVVKEKIDEEMTAGADGSLAGILSGIGSSVSEWIIDKGLTVDNHFVYSVGKFNTGQEVKTVSVGVFGHVFTFSKEDLDQALKEYTGN